MSAAPFLRGRDSRWAGGLVTAEILEGNEGRSRYEGTRQRLKRIKSPRDVPVPVQKCLRSAWFFSFFLQELTAANERSCLLAQRCAPAKWIITILLSLGLITSYSFCWVSSRVLTPLAWIWALPSRAPGKPPPLVAWLSRARHGAPGSLPPQIKSEHPERRWPCPRVKRFRIVATAPQNLAEEILFLGWLAFGQNAWPFPFVLLDVRRISQWRWCFDKSNR